MRLLLLLMTMSIALAGEVDLPPVVYIPTDKAVSVDPAGKTVLLPYARFAELWARANPEAPPVERLPPIGAALTGYALIGSVGVADGRPAAFTGRLVMTAVSLGADATGGGWTWVGLPGELSLSAVTCSDKRVVVERVRGVVYILAAGETLAQVAKQFPKVGEAAIRAANPGLVSGVTMAAGCPVIIPVDESSLLRLHLPAAGTYRIEADLAAPVVIDAQGRRSVDLALPAAAAGKVEIRLPEAEAAVQVTPAVAATVIGSATGTTVQAVAGSAGRMLVQWQPPIQQTAGEAMLLAASDVLISVGERSLRWDAGIDLTILRAPIRTVRIAVPTDTQVIGVEAPGMRTWDRTGDTLAVQLHEAAEGRLRLVLRLERLLPAAEPGTAQALAVGFPAVADAVRQSGQVALAAAPGLALTVTQAEGLAQVDPTELAVAQPVVAAWRYAAVPKAMAITATRLQSELRANVFQLVRLGADEDLITVVVQLDVRKAGLFAVRLAAPVAWELTDTTGLAVDEVAREADGHVRMTLKNRLLGQGELVVRLRAPATIPREAGKTATTAIPAVIVEDARQVRGTIAVAAPRSWAATTTGRDGLSGLDVEPLRREGPLAAIVRDLRDDEDLALAFTWIRSGGATPELRLGAAARARELTLRQEERIIVAESGLRRTVTWRGEVRFSGLGALRLTAPTALDEVLSFKGPQLAERSVVARADGLTTWELRFQAPVVGAFTITAEHALAMPTLAPGTPVRIEVPALTCTDAARFTAISAVARDGNLDVVGAANGAEVVPVADLPAGIQGAGTVAGFSAAAPIALAVTVTRHELIPMADLALPVVRHLAVASADGALRILTRAVVTGRSLGVLTLRLPAGGTLVEATIDGAPTRPSRTADGAVVLSLAGRATQRRLALVWDLPTAGRLDATSGRIDVPLPALGAGATGQRPAPVDRTDVELWLPEPCLVLGAAGEFGLDQQPLSAWASLTREWLATPDTAEPGTQGAGEDGLTVPVTPSGVVHHLSRLGDGGSVAVRWIRRGTLDVLALALALAGLTAAWLLRRRAQALGALGVAATALWLAAAPPWTVAAGGLLAGVVAGLALMMAVRLWQAIAARRAERRSLRAAETLFAAAPRPAAEVPPQPQPAVEPPTIDGGQDKP